MGMERSWKDPRQYKPVKSSKLKSNPEHQQALFLLKYVYYAIYSILSCADVVGTWQKKQLSLLYNKFLKLLNELLAIKSLSHLSAYSPDLPSSLVNKPLFTEMEPWEWEDIKEFYNIIINVKLTQDTGKLSLPKHIKDSLERVVKLLSEENFDTEILRNLLKDKQTSKSKLILYSDGKAVFKSTDGKSYKAEFSLKSNGYKLLDFLTRKPFATFSFDKLSKAICGSKYDTDERMVRDTVQYVRKKLKLPRQNKFLRSKLGFGLNCEVERRH